MEPTLKDLLSELSPGNPVVAALRPDPVVTAAGPTRVGLSTRGSAAIVQGTLLRPDGDEPSPAGAHALDLTFDLPDALVWTMRGGRFESAYPAAAFAPVARAMHPRLQMPWPARLAEHAFGSVDGRSSDGEMPFFLVTDIDGTHGIWVAVGTSGTWRATFQKEMRDDVHRLRVTTAGCGVTVEPGEEVVLPRMFVGAFEGDGWDAIRRFLMAERERPAAPWVVYNTWFNEEARINEERVLRHVPVAADLGFEGFCIDAAWYQTPPGDPGNFQTEGLGTWTVDTHKFPNGLEAVSKVVRDAGLRFGLWFEPERAHLESAVAKAHPDWIRTVEGQEFGLVDFGVADARSWALELMSKGITDWSLGWVKWDMNIHLLVPYWAGDERAELAHMRGVWEVADELRRRHPDLVLEMCASGGNRIDVEQLLRCDTYWISDQTVNPDLVRDTMWNALRFLPAQHSYLSLAPNLGDQTRDDFPDEWFVGNMGGVLGIMEMLAEWPDAVRERARRHIAIFKEIRHLLDGDIRRFRDRPEVPFAGWDALELSDPTTGEAALIALRLRSPESTRTFTGTRSWTVTIDDLGGATVLHHRPA